jgi:DNA-binding response OmpR family regulator
MTVLIIDNSVFLREKLVKAFYEIDNTLLIREESTFDSGESAFNSCKPDLVILEIDLLSNGGMSLLRKMKITSPASVVIIFTDHSTEEFKTKYLQAGADYFFDKCKQYREMLEVTRNLVINKRTKQLTNLK